MNQIRHRRGGGTQEETVTAPLFVQEKLDRTSWSMRRRFIMNVIMIIVSSGMSGCNRTAAAATAGAWGATRQKQQDRG
jgi:hypothetical protein